MSRATCPKCGSTDVSWIRDDADCAQYICLECKQGFYYPPKLLFDRITQSPERLAETYMFNYDGKVFKSLLLPNMVFNSREEAHSATVEKLKEVEK